MSWLVLRWTWLWFEWAAQVAVALPARWYADDAETAVARHNGKDWSTDTPQAMTCTHEKNVACWSAFGAACCLRPPSLAWLSGRSRHGQLRHHEEDACEAEKAPHTIEVPPPKGKEMVEGVTPMHAVGKRADQLHVGTPVIDVAARDAELNECAS